VDFRCQKFLLFAPLQLISELSSDRYFPNIALQSVCLNSLILTKIPFQADQMFCMAAGQSNLIDAGWVLKEGHEILAAFPL
jgi:hypothetical protein